MTTKLCPPFDPGLQMIEGGILNQLLEGTLAFEDLAVSGTITASGGVVNTGNLTIAGTLDVTGNASLDGNNTITGTTVQTGAITITGAARHSSTTNMVGNVSLGSSAVVGSPAFHVVAAAPMAMALSTSATVASANYAVGVPAGSTLIAVEVITTTTFGAATDSKFQAGTVAGGAEYIASTSVSLAGPHSMTFSATNNTQAAKILSMPALDASGNNFFGSIVMTGAGSTLGGATAIITYITP